MDLLARGRGRRRSRPILATALLLHLAGTAYPALAQTPGPQGATPTVEWTVEPIVALPGGGPAEVVLKGKIREGWHVYGLNQSSDGPTPLLVALEDNVTAAPAGAPQASAPLNAFEPAFGAVAPYHTRTLTVSLPVLLNSTLAPGAYSLPISVRYQACNGETCLPPRTVSLAAPVEIKSGS
jgi:DsbC/DsbD-like thiol-disulfide interchange protein